MISSKGFDFDGRIAEDFKLASGTWVSVGPLRARFVAACAPLVRDVVIAGINRDEISALVILDLDGCRLINPTLAGDDLAAAASDPLIRDAFRERLAKLSGEARRGRRPGSRARCCSIRRCRSTAAKSPTRARSTSARCWSIAAALIDLLYSPTPPAHVITL